MDTTTTTTREVAGEALARIQGDGVFITGWGALLIFLFVVLFWVSVMGLSSDIHKAGKR